MNPVVSPGVFLGSIPPKYCPIAAPSNMILNLSKFLHTYRSSSVSDSISLNIGNPSMSSGDCFRIMAKFSMSFSWILS